MENKDMHIRTRFSPDQLKTVEDAVAVAEELVGNHYKMSSVQWLHSRYEVRTAKDLAEHEIIRGPFAQVVKYEARKKGAYLSSAAFTCYIICLQDGTILETVEKRDALHLMPFLLYIMVHELIHIVRFSRFHRMYEKSDEPAMELAEERKVHDITCTILENVSVKGILSVNEHFEKWRIQNT